MRYFIAIILFFALPASFIAFWKSLLLVIQDSHLIWAIGIGFVLGFVIDEYIIRKIPVIETFEHELTHALTAMLFFSRITKFEVSRRGGLVQHQGGFGGIIADDFIGLAPYVLPTFTFISVLLRPVIPHQYFPYYDIWIGITLGYHTWSTIREIRENWDDDLIHVPGSNQPIPTDIGKRGFVFSAIYIATVTLILHGITFAVLAKGYHGFRIWFVYFKPIFYSLILSIYEIFHKIIF